MKPANPRLGVVAVLLLAAGAAPPALAAGAELVLFNGHVFTVDRDFSVASAVAVNDGRIVAVGSDAQVLLAFTGAARIDLRGRTLMPGFSDVHLHPYSVSPRDIDASRARSMAELHDMLRRKAMELGPGEWITGRGWQESNFRENRNITRHDLDIGAPDNPVALVRAGAHSTVGNSAALERAGIDRNTKDPARGLIEHDAAGEPNGIVRERNDLYLDLIPKNRFEDVRQSYIDGLRALFALGITSIMDASGTIDDEPVGAGGIASPGPDLTFRRAREIYAREGDTLPRMTMYIRYPGAARLKAFPHHTGFGDAHVRLGPIGENAVDGGFTGPTAWLLADYKGEPGFRGKGRFSDAELQEMVDTSARLGWQLGLHAIGDAAIVQTVDAYDKALNAIPGGEHVGADRRWFTNHFTIMPPDRTMATMARDGIMIAQQPNFLYNLEDRYLQTLDGWRLEHNNAIATPAKTFNIFMAFSSDNLPINPMVGIYAATTRTGPSGQVHGREEAISRAEAIRAYTANGPYLSWEEAARGTLEVGKLADMVVLPADPLTVADDALLHLRVDMTFLAGRLVYAVDGAPAGRPR